LFEFTSTNGSLGFSTGGGGAVLVKGFFLGGYGLNLRSNISQKLDDQNFNLEFEHGGFWLGYIHDKSSRFTFSISSKLGWGNVGFGNDNQINIIKRNAFVVTPEVTAELRVADFFKIGLGLVYRVTDELDSPLLENQNLNGFGGNISLKFGWFR
jgi:hypothetical protein